MSSSDSNSEIPEWLELSLFESIVAKQLNLSTSEFDLNFFSVKPAVAQGENYVSFVTRVQLGVTIKNDETSARTFNFIVKSNISGLQIIEEMEVFEKEMEFFTEIIPKLKELDATVEIAPECFLTTKRKKKIIILEDLAERGYIMKNRLDGLDLDHCKLYYKKLAEFHAMTAAYHDKFGDFHKRFHKLYFNYDYKAFFDSRVTKSMAEFTAIFDRYDALHRFSSKVANYGENLFESIYNMMVPKPDDFLVLNHGDSWLNNVLFLSDANNKPIDARLIDFQIANFGSPLIDIFYFFVSSPTNDVREHHFDELIRTYHDHLTANLVKFNYSKRVPTLRELHIEILEKGFLAAYFITAITTIALLDSKNSDKSETFMQEDDRAARYRYTLYNNPRYLKAVESTFKFLDNRGMLEKL